MKRLVIDVDDTLTFNDSAPSYADKACREAVAAKLHEYKAQGFEIVLYSSRNMRTFNGAIGKINVHTLPTLLAWLDRHDIPYDEVIMGKPWCGDEGFYVDDKTVRPDEFVAMNYGEIRAALKLGQG